MSNDAAREQLAGVLVGLREQLGDMAAVQKQLAALEVGGEGAEGSIAVTVNARGQLIKTVIDQSFLDEHDFDELGDCVTKAAQAAAEEAGRRVAELLAPINDRHTKLPSFSDIVADLPDPRDLMPSGLDVLGGSPQRPNASSVSSPGDIDGDSEGGAEFPTVRR